MRNHELAQSNYVQESEKVILTTVGMIAILHINNNKATPPKK